MLRAFRDFYGFNSYRMGKTRHTAPSLRLFRPEQANGAPLFPLFFEGSAFDVYVDLLLRQLFSNHCHRSLLKTSSTRAVSWWVFSQFGYQNHSKVFFLFSLSFSSTTVGAETPGGAGAPTYPALTPCTIFFRFGGGLPLHKVHFLILRNLREVATTCFAIFPPKISYGNLLGVPPHLRCDRFKSYRMEETRHNM
jgi:hypothetical protein